MERPETIVPYAQAGLRYDVGRYLESMCGDRSASHFAIRARVAPSTVSKIADGLYDLANDPVRRLARALAVPPHVQRAVQAVNAVLFNPSIAAIAEEEHRKGERTWLGDATAHVERAYETRSTHPEGVIYDLFCAAAVNALVFFHVERDGLDSAECDEVDLTGPKACAVVRTVLVRHDLDEDALIAANALLGWPGMDPRSELLIRAGCDLIMSYNILGRPVEAMDALKLRFDPQSPGTRALADRDRCFIEQQRGLALVMLMDQGYEVTVPSVKEAIRALTCAALPTARALGRYVLAVNIAATAAVLIASRAKHDRGLVDELLAGAWGDLDRLEGVRHVNASAWLHLDMARVALYQGALDQAQDELDGASEIADEHGFESLLQVALRVQRRIDQERGLPDPSARLTRRPGLIVRAALLVVGLLVAELVLGVDLLTATAEAHLAADD